jgi:sugar lactone lactonase YvrE
MKRVFVVLWLACAAASISACADDSSDAVADGSGFSDTLDGAEAGADAAGDTPGDAADSADADAEAPKPACWTDLAVGETVVFFDGFSEGSEGIAFDAAGRLFVSTPDTGEVWRLGPDGTAEVWASVPNALGIAAAPDGGLLVADIGDDGAGDALDGHVWHVDPDGAVSELASGIANPNFIVVLADGSALLSDDFDTRIFRIAPDGAVTVAIDGVPSPNGMGLSPDGGSLYVASTFSEGGEVTRFALGDDGLPTSAAGVVIAELGPAALPDGLAVDESDRVYVAANFQGELVRIAGDGSGEPEVVGGTMKNPASVAFGVAPDFDPCSVYVTELFGTKVWRIAVGARGR